MLKEACSKMPDCRRILRYPVIRLTYGKTCCLETSLVGSEDNYARIPLRDLTFGVPEWLGDDSWGRKANPRHNNSVRRPQPDDGHTLIWIAPKVEAVL